MFGLNKTYNINFITNCETKLNSIQLKNKAVIGELPSLKKDGYKFAGWFSDPQFEIEFKNEKMEKKDITLYAKWDRITMEEFLNDVNYYTKSANILKELQNDYSDVPQFKDETNKDTKTTKKKVTKKKTTKTKKASKGTVTNEEKEETLEETETVTEEEIVSEEVGSSEENQEAVEEKVEEAETETKTLDESNNDTESKDIE